MAGIPRAQQALIVRDAPSTSVGSWQAILTLVLFLVSSVFSHLFVPHTSTHNPHSV